ncbi:hypothetical protein [Salmonella phage SD-1_S14]|nr:hypothetical protein [Salmonella phage SD-1_S14]
MLKLLIIFSIHGKMLLLSIVIKKNKDDELTLSIGRDKIILRII